ncbi:MAG: hypothetical protein HOP09_04235 [Hyphomicrobium sp.]|nr:hypothetical protein [Hyphomicrobium sp.]
MKEFILLMHGDSEGAETSESWARYIASLKARGGFVGGSSMGAGAGFRKTGPAEPLSDSLTGFITLRANDLADARQCLEGNPVFECGGTVEIRELIKD